ncbi:MULTISPECIES: hemolysin family protein [Bacillota]|jgi:putative hemolysin|uniref:HlyC/CorC family transporter n=2 Tax=Amedibacillus TaxID=2749846 RepID=A0A7G9GTN2_9FIRM|nr:MULTISPECIES: hemolysin family protein [Bacillota]QNM14164.1 HlyC/CorC family transporter [[Eubacterium] hominis]MCH4285581.1 hemolysin family protein [Amedibacillus hominis]RGB52513.1 HlyC/CorC family transporter [Absiella sp. AM10-20]RGB54101.1 HlyC/CorC family transporter [Absiella sp. AM22-9]RGB64338.1 HlyC/CorC family transporter [Absiella sp. AM09-45]
MDDPQGSSIMVQLLLIVILTMINAYFAASEMAIVSVSKTKIHRLVEEGNKKAELVEKLLQEPTAFLSTIQVAITLAGFFNSASAATGISLRFATVLKQWQVPYGETIAIVVITILLSFVTLIFGELVPKRIALQNAEKFSMMCAKPIVVVSKIASPFIKILSWSTKFVLRLFGMHDENVEESLSREEIRSMVESGQENGVFNETETEMINSIFEFDDIQAEDVMTPRTEVFCIDINDPLDSYLDDLMEMHYTRIPVYEDTVDDIIGILHIKDFLIEAHKYHYDYTKVDIRKILRKPYFVLETKNIDELFKEMQKKRQHLAILVDEYGGFSGIATIEDLVEEIMGDIEDEYDEIEEPQLKKLDEHTYLIDGFMNVDDLNEELSLDLESEDHDTISGFLLDLLGKILEDGSKTSVDYKNLHFDILEVEDKHIEKIRLIIQPEEKTEE